MKPAYYVFFFLTAILTFWALTTDTPKKDGFYEIDSTATEIPNYDFYIERIDTFFEKRFDKGIFNGTVLYAEGKNIVYQKAFGFANFAKKDTLNLESSFQLASVSKTLTAFAILLLEQRGLVSFSDSIRKFIPRFPYENITIHQLLIHRTGLPVYTYFADELWKSAVSDSAITNNDVIDLMINYEPKKYNSPGKRYNYNNTNYVILAKIIEIVTGKSYEQFMSDEIFTPLQMNHTDIYNKALNPVNYHDVIGYVGRTRIAMNTYLNGAVGDKGIYSTVGDLFKFNRALFEGTIVTKEKMNDAYFLGHKELKPTDNYGHGWRIIQRSDSTKVVYHGGWWKGFRSYFIRELTTEKCIIVLTNRSNSGIIRIHDLMDLFDIRYE